MTELLYGKSPILEVLKAKRRKIVRFYYQPHKLGTDPFLRQVFDLLSKEKIPSSQVSKDFFDKKLPGVLTQGWVLEVSEYPYLEADQLLAALPPQGKGVVLILDQIQDPQNLGAILRSAECSGVAAVFLCLHQAAQVTPAVVKASAGSSEHLQISRVANINQLIEKLKEINFWVVGTSLAGTEEGLSFQWPDRIALVLGSEGEGMRPLVQKNCDFLLHFPVLGKIQSLNVSATAAVCLYEILRNHRNLA
jgi:23S rRNA (guanosine2251-2'-O)-methyltransferase